MQATTSASVFCKSESGNSMNGPNKNKKHEMSCYICSSGQFFERKGQVSDEQKLKIM